MISSKRDDVSEDAEKQTILAKKTLENLQVITVAQVILKEKFNGNPNSWIHALFEALSLKNPVYLMEEKKADPSNTFFSNKFDDSFWKKENVHNVTSTGHLLIDSFKKFMIGLNKNADMFNLDSLLPDLKDVEKNIHLYLNTTKQNDVKPAPAVREKSTFDRTTAMKEKDAARRPDVNQICTECNTKIAIFNNDIEFSYQLHCQEQVHQKAIIKHIPKTITEQTTKIFEKRRSDAEIFTPEEIAALRRTLDEKIKKHSHFILILTRREFRCKLCDCQISSLQNVVSHVEGIKHTNALRLLESKSSKLSDDILRIDHLDIPITKLM